MYAAGDARQAAVMAVQRAFTTMHEEFLAWTDQLRTGARLLARVDEASRFAIVADLVAFLQEKIEPHTYLDEHVLYPEGNARLGSPLGAAALAYDHLAIRSWIAKLAEADNEDVETLQELLYGLDALIRVHLWKEDELYVKPLGSAAWPASGA